MYDDTVLVDKAYYNKLKEQTTWISVKDGLPEPCKAVLVYGKSGDMVNWKVDYITECGMWAHSFTVTHWMPLPTPPEKPYEEWDRIAKERESR